MPHKLGSLVADVSDVGASVDGVIIHLEDNSKISDSDVTLNEEKRYNSQIISKAKSKSKFIWRLSWRFSAQDPVKVVGLFSLDLQRLLSIGVIRAENLDSVRLIVYHDEDGFYLRLNQKSPRIKLARPIIDKQNHSKVKHETSVVRDPGFSCVMSPSAEVSPAAIQQSETVFDGSLYEYMNFSSQYQIDSARKIEWQDRINAYHRSTSPKWIVVRFGIRNWKSCACVYEDQELGIKVLTTDNEATVSFYEYCRRSDVPDSFDLFSALKAGIIRSGTIKYGDKSVIRNCLRQHGLQDRSSTPRPFQFLKYSHIAGAKELLSSSLTVSSSEGIFAYGIRCISPCNVFLTHTPLSGNYSVKHRHTVDERFVHDLGESKGILPFFLAWNAKAATEVGGAAIFHEFCRLGDILPAVGLQEFNILSVEALIADLTKKLESAKDIHIRIEKLR